MRRAPERRAESPYIIAALPWDMISDPFRNRVRNSDEMIQAVRFSMK
jgi:hypothetical protein